MAERKTINIEVVFAAEQKQKLISLTVPRYTTAWQAVEQSGIMNHFPEYDFTDATIGVYGKMIPRGHLLSDHDRVEIYRELKREPTATRRIRARRAAEK